MKMRLHSFNSSTELTVTLADVIHDILISAIHKRGKAYLVVSGGKTPIDLFQALSCKELPWENVVVTLADERCVDAQRDESNEFLVKRYLLQHNASHANFYSLINQAPDLMDNLLRVNADFSQFPTFDAVILGMGEDGHTASLFPCSKEIQEGLTSESRCALLVNPLHAPFQRISLTKTRLLNAEHIFLHLIGKKKKEALQECLLNNNPFEKPIVAFLNDGKSKLQVMYAPAVEDNECIQ